jgi:hypothetical protein
LTINTFQTFPGSSPRETTSFFLLVIRKPLHQSAIPPLHSTLSYVRFLPPANKKIASLNLSCEPAQQVGVFPPPVRAGCNKTEYTRLKQEVVSVAVIMDFSSTGPVLSSCVSTASQQQSWEGCHAGADEPLGLPTGFSPRLDQPLAWTGAQFKDETEYVYQLTQAELAEINSGLQAFKGGFTWIPRVPGP